MKCFHHNDADGRLAGYWVHKRFPHLTKDDFIEIDYGMEDDWMSKFDNDEPIIIVDFSFEPDYMREIMKKTKNITWIDHHISSIKKYENFDSEIKGLRYDGIAGCMLTWAYFNKMKDGRIPFDVKMCNGAPWMTKYVSDYDVWKFEYGDETMHFSLGLKSVPNNGPLSSIWDELLEIGKVIGLISDGAIIEKYRNSIGADTCKKYGFEYELDGHRAFCLNNSFGGSEWFGDLIKKYDIVCAFLYNDKNKIWEYSLYSIKPNIDCSIIVQNLFGPESGGHKGAAGGVNKQFIFTK